MQPGSAPAADSHPIRFDGRVALVTGAGRGLGRAYALALAARGAAVVVNDAGLNLRGDDRGEHGPADSVVGEIRAAGGRAVADYGDVTDDGAAAAMVQRAIDAFGALDILVNNAGNNRRNVFPDTAAADLENVMSVHLGGSFRVSKAAWKVMAQRHYGRIVLTTSQVGFYGKVDSVAYGAAKAATVGLMHGLKLSADAVGIKVNCIAPFALTRMGEIFPTEIASQIDPAQVAAAVVLLCAEQCPLSGEILIGGGGHFAMARMVETRGIDIDKAEEINAELLARRLGEIGDFTEALTYPDALKAVGATFDRVKRRAGLA